MSVWPKALLWRRLDTTGTEHVLYDDHNGLRARGTIVAAAPVAYTCGYELETDAGWASVRLTVQTEGAGWQRRVALERGDATWRVTTSEHGDLDAALAAAGHPRSGLPGTEDPYLLADCIDVDLGYCPLTNTLPIRRLGLLDAPAGTQHTINAAWVLMPGLAVVANDQTYTVLGDHRITYSSGSFRADLEIDAAGYVIHYPGLAER